jgi:hypothetical protein
LGLVVNLQKSELFITIAPHEEAQQLAQIIGCNAATFPFIYLGLPLLNKKLTVSDFEQLVQKIASKLTGWRSALLSIAGRLILMQTILSAMPLYYMTIFMLPKNVISQIDKIRRKFLWQGNKP